MYIYIYIYIYIKDKGKEVVELIFHLIHLAILLINIHICLYTYI